MDLFKVYIFYRIGGGLVLLHIISCFLAIVGVILVPLLVLGFLGDLTLPGTLLNEAKSVSVPLVNREHEVRRSSDGKFVCEVDLPPAIFPDITHRTAIPVYRNEPSGDLTHLKIFAHPILKRSEGVYHVVEIPANLTWNEVFQATTERTLAGAIISLVLTTAFFGVAIWFSIWGYFFIKHGPKGRDPHRHKRR